MKSRMIARRKQSAEAPPPVPPAEATPAAPAPEATPAPAVESQTYASMDEAVHGVSTDVLASMVKALVGGKEFANDKAAQFLIEQLTSELKTRPVQTQDGQPKPAAPVAPAAPPPAAAPVKASKDGCKFCGKPTGGAAYCKNCLTDEEKKKNSSWTPQNEKTMELEEGGSRVPEIAEAHSKQDDNTGVVKTKVILPEKLAGDMATSSAVKKAESLTDGLKKTYLDAKVLTTVNNTRPVRDAVESIFAASSRMEEATKTLSKQLQLEEEEELAAKKALEGKKSSAKYKLGGLIVATAE